MSDALPWFALVADVLILFALLRLSLLLQRTKGLSRIEAKLDLLLKNAGVSYDPSKDVPPPVAEAIQRGDKIAAIKAYRDATGVGLAQAKEFVEEVQRRMDR